MESAKKILHLPANVRIPVVGWEGIATVRGVELVCMCILNPYFDTLVQKMIHCK